MKKLLTLLAALAVTLALAVTAWADYDYIDRYDITVTPDTDDGSLSITVSMDWTPLEELPYGQELKIGIPNGSLREETALTDNIERLTYDNSYMYVYFDRAYNADETFTFAFSWVQEFMYTLDGDAVSYDYTPGWFDEAQIGVMTLTWNGGAARRRYPDGLRRGLRQDHDHQRPVRQLAYCAGSGLQRRQHAC